MSVNLKTIYAFAREMHSKNINKPIQYGTAGFRTKATDLDYVMFRMGVLAALRSRVKNTAVIGLMITASHNPEEDNGIKLVDPHGEMLEQSWEVLATQLANVSDSELEATVEKIVKDLNIDLNLKANVFIGMDTRYSSPSLCKAAVDGVLSIRGSPREFGIVSTPMLHYFVLCANTDQAYGKPTEEGYYTKLITAFKTLRGDVTSNGKYSPKFIFDGANGVGGKKMVQFQKRLGDSIDVDIYNNGKGKLNFKCGADFVKVQQCSPHGIPIEKNVRCVSVDGDADRVVYHFVDDNDVFHLLDGDRIATLLAGFLMEKVKATGLDIGFGLVQTAYANGASTRYITDELRVSVACVPTGVKHLHHRAQDFDIGVYFEANGHGTVLFSNDAKLKLKYASLDSSLEESQINAAKELMNLIDLTNETVGDAISDMLLVETVLHSRGWDLNDWLNTYTDLPNRQLKVTVQDRTLITTKDAERICVTPEGLQDEIKNLVSKYQDGRAFVRPSGTEDIVRVYAEAATRDEADSLATEVAKAVFRLAGGVGEEPKQNFTH
uniref:Phosphoacetylglucosamine mutase n=1 Tax=Xenopsylla cheopis TaxID=163159 RepID=A0A6M2DJM3_XENCH